MAKKILKFLKSIFGTVDRVIIRDTHVDIVDFKFGFGEIDDADINIQGQAYLLGVMDRFPQIQTATVHFLAPRRDEVLKHSYKREDMETIRTRINLLVNRAESDDKVLTPNTEACKYCKHKLSCPALSEKMLPLAKKYSAGEADFEMTLWESYSPAEINDPVVLSKMLNVATVVEKWASAAKARALELAVEEGEEIPGYSLNFRNATPKITETQDAFEAVEHLLTPEEFMSVCSVTPAAIAKAYAEKLERGQKKTARPTVDQALEESGVIASVEERSMTPYLKKSKNL